jgi:alkanesulfonate monooxygenase SsuD/methylene tetrahydromethanopterin reductase-like flavin-dependent oxidoreductase (luciferase family)
MNTQKRDSKRIPLGLNLGIWDRMTTWDQALDIARLADELGYDCLMIPESFGRDGVSLCDRLLAATENINVCFGIANVFSRSPAVLASTAATLDELSGGRFILGLGGSTPNLVEGWHGLEFKAPQARTREAIAICRKIWARDRSPFEGKFFRTGGVKLSFEPLREEIPIWHGAVLERGLQVCGELADGWMPANLPAECIGWGRGILASQAAASGRDVDTVTVAPTFQLLAHEDPGQVLPMAKFGIAMYYGQANSPYARAAVALGYEQDVQDIQAAYQEGGAERASAAVSDRLARSISIAGSVTECRSRIDQLLSEGADRVVVTMPAATRAECEPVLSGIIPARYQ